MITYIIICYINYEIVRLQVENFKNKFTPNTYKLKIIDNTPIGDKKIEYIEYIKNSNNVTDFINVDELNIEYFDGISHGHAINVGISNCDTEFICIMDSDFFFIKDNIHIDAIDCLKNGFDAVGCEFNDGTDYCVEFVEKYKDKFNNGTAFCGFYKTDMVRNIYWIVTQDDTNVGDGYVEVGYKVRKYMNENELCTKQWKVVNTERPTFFKNDNNEMIGVHLVRGTYLDKNNRTHDVENIKKMLNIK